MSVKRKIRIDLGSLSPEWKSSFIIIRGLGTEEIIESRRNARKIEKEIERIQTALPLATEEEAEVLEAGLAEWNEKQLRQAQVIVTSNFVSGFIFDFDTGVERDMAAEDIIDMDIETVGFIIGTLMGVNQKKTV